MCHSGFMSLLISVEFHQLRSGLTQWLIKSIASISENELREGLLGHKLLLKRQLGFGGMKIHIQGEQIVQELCKKLVADIMQR